MALLDKFFFHVMKNQHIDHMNGFYACFWLYKTQSLYFVTTVMILPGLTAEDDIVFENPESIDVDF